MRKLIIVGLIVVGSFADVTKSGDIVTDSDTGLQWQDSSEIAKLNWSEAIEYCEALSLGGYSDWRLPNRNELQSIVDISRYNPAIKEGFENTESDGYWSSSSYASDSNSAWKVNFDNGDTDYYRKSYDFVRCVR
jgi:hypothetical protein